MHTTTSRRLVLTAVPALLVLTLGACAGDDHGSMGPMAGARQPSAGSSAADHDQADVMFSMMMVPHHEQALEMADLVPSRTDDAPLLDLARRIEAGQQPEIDRMNGWLEEWGARAMSGHDHMGTGMGGMMSDADMDELRALRGEPFRIRWLEMMVEHHEGAVDMAEDVLRSGTHAGTAELARTIIEAQQREIEEMRTMLGA